MISLKNITKRYGSTQALSGISFEVRRGEIVGFLGPNGAGKTTIMKILTGYIAATSGTVTVDDLDILTESLEIRRRIGYLPENAPVYQDMRVNDYLTFMGKIRGLQGAELDRRRKIVIGLTALKDVLGKDISQLSKGYRQRVGLAQALIHDPPILILDEPTSGLDPNQIAEIRTMIKEIGQKKTVILSTHILPEVEATTDRILIIADGKLVADGTTEDLRAGAHQGTRMNVLLELSDKASAEHIRKQLAALPGVNAVNTVATDETNAQGFLISGAHETDQDLRRVVFQYSVKQGWTLLDLHREDQSLEAIFRRLTRGEDQT